MSRQLRSTCRAMPCVVGDVDRPRCSNALPVLAATPLARSPGRRPPPGYVMPRAEHASRQALRLFPRATVTGNANGMRPRCYPALSCPMRSIGHANAPSGTAIRSSGGSAYRYSAEPPLHRPPYSFTCTPTASVRTNQHFKARLSSTAGKPDVRPHTRRPPLPRLAHAACGARVAPSPPVECRRGRRHLNASLLLCGLRNR